MDEDDIAILSFLFIVIAIILIITYFVIISPIRQDNAQKYCNNLGEETFIKYNNMFFQTTPVAIVCGTMNERLIADKTIKAYSTNGDGKLIVQEIKS